MKKNYEWIVSRSQLFNQSNNFLLLKSNLYFLSITCSFFFNEVTCSCKGTFSSIS